MNNVLKKIFINAYYAENQKYTESVLNISKVEKSQYLIDNIVNCLTVSSKNLQGIFKLILVSTLFVLSGLTWAASGDYSTETIGSTCTTRCQSGHDSHRNDSSHASLQGLKVDKGGKGATGLQGLSAYDLAEKNGYKGYLGKWLGAFSFHSFHRLSSKSFFFLPFYKKRKSIYILFCLGFCWGLWKRLSLLRQIRNQIVW